MVPLNRKEDSQPAFRKGLLQHSTSPQFRCILAERKLPVLYNQECLLLKRRAFKIVFYFQRQINIFIVILKNSFFQIILKFIKKYLLVYSFYKFFFISFPGSLEETNLLLLLVVVYLLLLTSFQNRFFIIFPIKKEKLLF